MNDETEKDRGLRILIFVERIVRKMILAPLEITLNTCSFPCSLIARFQSSVAASTPYPMMGLLPFGSWRGVVTISHAWLGTDHQRHTSPRKKNPHMPVPLPKKTFCMRAITHSLNPARKKQTLNQDSPSPWKTPFYGRDSCPFLGDELLNACAAWKCETRQMKKGLIRLQTRASRGSRRWLLGMAGKVYIVKQAGTPSR